MRVRMMGKFSLGLYLGQALRELWKQNYADAIGLAIIGVVFWFLVFVDWFPYRVRLERRPTPDPTPPEPQQ